MTRLLDDSFQADSSEDDTGFEEEESINPLYIACTHQQNKYYGACIRETGYYGTSFYSLENDCSIVPNFPYYKCVIRQARSATAEDRSAGRRG